MRLAFHATRPARALAGGALVLALAGCAGMNSQGLFGAPGTDVDAAAAKGPVSPSGTTVVGSGPDAVTYACPPVTVRSGASTWQLPAAGGGLRAQGSFGNLARECNVANGQMTIKVGIEGRVLLGEKGTPGAFTVPVRVALVEEGPNPRTQVSKFFVVPVQVPQNESQALFSVVEDTISLPLPSTPDDLERYMIYVGFDSKGEVEKPARPRATPRPAAARPAATTTAPATSAPATAPAPAAAAPASGDSTGPKGDVFGPPPTFTAPPPSGTFGPPPTTFGPTPAQ